MKLLRFVCCENNARINGLFAISPINDQQWVFKLKVLTLFISTIRYLPLATLEREVTFCRAAGRAAR